MKLATRTFGEIEIDDERVMQFIGPMLGFEGADQYVLLDVAPNSPFKIMQLVDDADVSFLVTDPTLFFPEYDVQLTQEQAAELQLTDLAKAAVMVVVNIQKERGATTANLFAPVVVNTETLLAKQILLRDSSYPVDQPLPLDRPAADG